MDTFIAGNSEGKFYYKTGGFTEYLQFFIQNSIKNKQKYLQINYQYHTETKRHKDFVLALFLYKKDKIKQ